MLPAHPTRKVIVAMKAKHAGRIDFGKASGLVKEMLGKLG